MRSRYIRFLTFFLALTFLVACNPAKDRYTADVEYLASEPRYPDTKHHANARQLCIDRFKQLGYDVSVQDYGTGQNVIGVKTGMQLPQEHIIVSAHYDSVNECKGADDNATGVAAIFENARQLSEKQHKRTLVVACWDEEERGLIGSWKYATRARAKNQQINLAYAYDMIGYKSNKPNSQVLPSLLEKHLPSWVINFLDTNERRANFISVIANKGAEEYLTPLPPATPNALYLPVIFTDAQIANDEIRSYTRRSDHDSFWQTGYNAVLVTDTAELRNPGYHCAQQEDDIRYVDMDFALDITQTVQRTIEYALNK